MINEKKKVISQETMSSSLPDAENYHKWVFSQFMRYVTGNVLEIGVGYGQYTSWIAERGTNVLSIDIDPAAINALDGKLPENVTLGVGDIANKIDCERLGHSMIDFLVCLNVIEHVDNDHEAIRNMYNLMASGGKAFILVPAFPNLYGPMDKIAGHFRRYTRNELALVMSKAGFSVIKTMYFNCIGGIGWWLNAKFLKPKSLSDDSVNRQIVFFDRYVIPISKLLTPFTSTLFGQSVWILVEKK